jgi:hypothetical protein
MMIGDAYPLLDITEILDQLGQTKYFMCIGIVVGYHQIEMDPKDIDRMAFSMNQGHWAYKRMSFGLRTAPVMFQRMVNIMLSSLTGPWCFVVLDDIVIYANLLIEHDSKLRAVFERLRKYNLKLHTDKCEFLRKEVNSLGHIIGEDRVRPNPRKIKSVEEFPTPRNT